MMEKFKRNNPTAEIEEFPDYILIRKAWDDDTIALKIPRGKIALLSDIVLYKEFSAMYNQQTNTFEFFFDLVKKDSKYWGRTFKITFKGKEYRAEYHEPSEAFEVMAMSVEMVSDESESDFRNFLRFKSYYNSIGEKDINAHDDGTKIPANFFLQGDGFRSLDDKGRIELFKHINFYMSYYDRVSPYILILDADRTYSGEKHKVPSLDFPQSINAAPIDVTLLDLFQTAHTTRSTRLQYLFYYQVLEYCSYYYLKDELRHKLKNIVKKPDLLNNSDFYIQKLIDELRDSLKNERDEYQMEKLITTYCDYSDIKNELKTNGDHFTKDLQFDGGFVLKKLFNSIDEIDKPQPDIMKSIKERIDKIRNVMVHVRGNRENKVILPTRHNTNLLIPYLYLIRRIAEVVAFSHE